MYKNIGNPSLLARKFHKLALPSFKMQCDEQQETPMLTEEYIEPHCQWTRGKELDRIEITLDGIVFFFSF